MNFIDYAIIVVVGIFTIKGLIRGVLQETFGFVGLIISLIVATKFMSNAAAWFTEFNIRPAISTVLGFLIIFVAMILATQMLIHFLRKITKYSLLNWLEKLVGGLVGFLKGGITASLLLLFLAMIPFGNQFLSGQKESLLFEPTKNFAPHVFNIFMKIIPNSKKFLDELKETPLDEISFKKLFGQLQSNHNGQDPQNKKSDD